MVDEIQYLQDLIATHQRRLAVLQQQVAMAGKIAAPPEKLLEIEDITQEINELEQRKRRKIRNADNGHFYSAEELDEISEKIAGIAELERVIPMQEGTVKTLQEAFYRQQQSSKMKLFIGLVITVAVLPFVRLIGDIVSSAQPLWVKMPLILLVILACAALLLYAWRWVKTELYGNIREMEIRLQENKDELQRRKSELSKIYRVNEEKNVL